MRLFFFLFLFNVYAVTVVAQQGFSQTSPANSLPQVYAVVVGVSRYQDPDIRQLQFANRDAAIFAEFLMSKAGGAVPKNNILLLTDSAATQAAVYMALSGLAKKCNENDLIFFYFSGHGDLENVTLFNNGYLICYNSPPTNYIGLALSIRDVNELANTFSVKMKAKVVLITDACHSGNMSDSRSAGNAMSAQQRIDANEKVVRIASSKPDQLSNEKMDWGGGRGVFSYYLLKGLTGMADKSNDGTVTLGELKKFMETSLENDPVLKLENTIQTPVLSGNDAFPLSKVNSEDLQTVLQQSAIDSVSLARIGEAALTSDADLSPEEYFISAFKNENLTTLVDILELQDLDAAEIPFTIINYLKHDLNVKLENKWLAKKDSMLFETRRNKLNDLISNLQQDKESLVRFNEDIMIVIDDKVQEVINQYLKGDEAELERRRYYNNNISNYDAYPKLLSVALKLIPPNEYYYKILQVKMHYFTGVVHRLKIPTTDNHDSLINLAFTEQQKALALQERAPYIYNETGILYMAKKQTAKAEENFLKATTMATNWALPWANLSYLYAVTGRDETGLIACNKADSLQPGLPCISNNFGLLNEHTGNLLFAEENYRRSIDLNSRHYLPFERLGYLYLNTARYALADSFFNEAENRKMGLQFEAPLEALQSYPGSPNNYEREKEPCYVPETTDAKDLMTFFYKGLSAYKYKDTAGAISMLKKVIGIDPKNPLAFHYLGKIFFEQRKWEEGELMFNFAIRFNLDHDAFNNYCDSVIKAVNYSYPHTCLEDFFRDHYYNKVEDLFFIAHIYETWAYYAEAEAVYNTIVELEPEQIGGYAKSWRLLEKLGRYTEAENRIKSFRTIDAERSDNELNAFYRRAIDQFPANNQEWTYRLGLLLYNRAKLPSLRNYLDSIVWFPKLNKELFIDTDVLNLTYTSDDYDITDLTATNSDNFLAPRPRRLSDKRNKQVELPGTGELVYLADNIYTPRLDGIRYLLKAAESFSSKDILADIQIKVGNIYVWAGSKKQAYPFYARSVELAPGNANTRLQLVDAGVAIYKNKATLEQLNYLYDSGQINFPKRMLLAEMAMYAGQFERSKKILDEARQIYPFNLDKFTELNGRLNLLANKPDEAIAAYIKYVTDINPGDADAYYTLARLYAGKQNSAQAFIWLKKAINNGFRYTYVLELDPMMNELRKKPEWDRLVAKPMKTKLKQKGLLFDY